MSKNLEELTQLIFTLSRIIREQVAWNWTIDFWSIVQLKILHLVSERWQPTMNDIANSLFIKLPTATSIIDRLVKNWQLERISDDKDRRIVRLKITELWKKSHNLWRTNMYEKMDNILDCLDKNEIEQFKQILKKIINSHTK